MSSKSTITEFESTKKQEVEQEKTKKRESLLKREADAFEQQKSSINEFEASKKQEAEKAAKLKVFLLINNCRRPRMQERKRKHFSRLSSR